MARVPTPARQIATVRNTRAPNQFQSSAGVTAESFGAGVGRALQQTGQAFAQASDVLAKNALIDQQIDNETAAKEADAAYNAERRRILFGDGQNPGYYGQKGAEAVRNQPVVQKQLDELREKFTKDIKNPAVRRIFSSSALSKAGSDAETILRHTAKERIVAASSASVTRQVDATDEAVAAYNDLTVAKRSAGIVRAEAISQAQAQGLEGAQVGEAAQQAETAMYSSMFKAAIQNNDPATAEQILNQMKAVNAKPEVIAQLTKDLEKPAQLQKEQEATALIVGTEGDENAQLKAADKLPSEIQDGVKKRIRQFNVDKRRAEKAQANDLRGSWHRQIISQGADHKSLEELIAQNPDEWALLSKDVEDTKALQAADRSFRLKKDFADVTDQKTRDKFDKMETEELAKVDPSQWKSMFTETDYNRFVRAVSGAKEDMKKNGPVYKTNNNLFQILKRHPLVDKNMKMGSPARQSKQQREREQKYRNFLNAKSAEWHAENAGTPPPALLSEWVDDALQEIETPGIAERLTGNALLTDGVPVAEAIVDFTPAEKARARIDIDQLTTKEIDQIKQTFKKNSTSKIPPTDDIIEQYAGAVIFQDKPRMDRLLGIKAGRAPVSRAVPVPNEIPAANNAGGTTPIPAPPVSDVALGEGIIPRIAEEPAVPTVPETPPAPPPLSPEDQAILDTPAAFPLDTPAAFPLDPPVEAVAPPEPEPIPPPVIQRSVVTDVLNEDIATFIQGNEGYRSTVYKDTASKDTVGFGFNLDKPGAREQVEAAGLDYDAIKGGKRITRADANKLFQIASEVAVEEARRVIPNFDILTDNRQKAFIDMAYNMGATALSGFVDMIAAIAIDDWDEAAKEAKDSEWFKKTGSRARKVVELIKEG